MATRLRLPAAQLYFDSMRLRFAIFILAALCSAQATLNNDAIVKMLKAGLSEEIVVSTIKTQPGQYATSADDLIALKKAGVADKVLTAMIDKATAPASAGNPLVAAASGPAAAPAPSGRAELPAPVVSEVGVYYNKNGAWADVLPEIVDSKTTGTLKKVVGKGAINGHIKGLHSPNQLKVPIELLVYVEEGVAITEYKLLRLTEQKDAREFRSGADPRDQMLFDSKKVAPRTYLITLSAMASGEYGLLQAGRPSRIYSFSVIP